MARNAETVAEATKDTTIIAEGAQPADTATTETEPKLSPKNKLMRGVSEDTVTTWVPLDRTSEQNKLIQRAAKGYGGKVGDMLASMLAGVLDSDAGRAKIQEYADKAPVTKEKTAKLSIPDDPAEAEKYVAEQEAKLSARAQKAQAAVERAREALKKAREIAASRGVVAAQAQVESDGPTV